VAETNVEGCKEVTANKAQICVERMKMIFKYCTVVFYYALLL